MPAAGGAHHSEGGQGPVEGADGVYLQHRAVISRILLVDHAGKQDPGVVDPHVQRAGPLRRACRRGVACGSIGDVQGDRPCPRADARSSASGHGAVDVGDSDLVPARGEHSSDREPEPAARAGDQCARHRGSLRAVRERAISKKAGGSSLLGSRQLSPSPRRPKGMPDRASDRGGDRGTQSLGRIAASVPCSAIFQREPVS